jgi:hypothetical protein
MRGGRGGGGRGGRGGPYNKDSLSHLTKEEREQLKKEYEIEPQFDYHNKL